MLWINIYAEYVKKGKIELLKQKMKAIKLLYVSGLRNYKKENELKEMKKTSKEDENL